MIPRGGVWLSTRKEFRVSWTPSPPAPDGPQAQWNPPITKVARATGHLQRPPVAWPRLSAQRLEESAS